jgi:hypothetical protein
MLGSFKFRDKTYTEIGKYNFAETSWIESTFHCDISELHETQNLLVTLFLAMKRANPGGVKWDEMLELSPDDFEFLPAPPEILTDPPAIPPESEWPVDPTDAVRLTADRSESHHQNSPTAG